MIDTMMEDRWIEEESKSDPGWISAAAYASGMS